MKNYAKGISKAFGIILLIGLGSIVFLFGASDIPTDTLKERYASPSSTFVKVEGMNVHIMDEGPKTDTLPIVLIHGTGASLHTFDKWTKTLSKSRRVIRMDLPAYGLTGPFHNADYSIGHYVSFLELLLAELSIESCVLGGNSLGGEIAWQYTLAFPDRIKKLLLIDAAGYPSASKSEPAAFTIARIPILNQLFTYITPRFIVAASIRNVYANPSSITPELVDRYFELSHRPGNRQAFIDRLQQEKDYSKVAYLPTIQQPTLILWGAKDQLIPIDFARRFEKELPNDTLIIIENSGHVPMEESPSESLEAISFFF